MSGTVRPPPSGPRMGTSAMRYSAVRGRAGISFRRAEHWQEGQWGHHPDDRVDVLLAEEVADRSERVSDHGDQDVEERRAVGVERSGGDEAGRPQGRLDEQQRAEGPGETADEGAQAGAPLAFEHEQQPHRGDDETELGAEPDGEDGGDGETAPAAALGVVRRREQWGDRHRRGVEVGEVEPDDGGMQGVGEAEGAGGPDAQQRHPPRQLPQGQQSEGERAGLDGEQRVHRRQDAGHRRDRYEQDREAIGEQVPLGADGRHRCPSPHQLPRRLQVPGEVVTGVEPRCTGEGERGVHDEQDGGGDPGPDAVDPLRVEPRLPPQHEPLEAIAAAPGQPRRSDR